MSGRSSTLELSILGDALEEHRIQLEQNLQQTDLSLHLSSPQQDYSDIEHPRHHSDPYTFSGIASFDRSREALERSDPNFNQHWSYRATEEDDGYNPYAGETISTAAHHASALTLSAGLGGRGARRDVSLSGAEYDPDRPVQGIMAGMNYGSKNRSFSYTSKPKQMTSTTVDFDPLVVDDTTELDRIFQTCRPEQISGLQSPPSSCVSDPPLPNDILRSPRPKLADALHRVTFSPKRPRSAQATPSHRSIRSAKKADQSSSATPGLATTRERSHQSLSYGVIRPSVFADEPAVNVHPPTPPQADGSSKFTKLARGLAAEIQAESYPRRPPNDKLPSVAQSTIRKRPPSTRTTQSPFKDNVYHMKSPADGDRTQMKHASIKSLNKGRVHLPDVTGLTSAVQSPSRLGLGHIFYDAKEDREIDAELMTTLGVVQSKLAYLEAENSISRRRVRELEYELDECRKEVAKEQTRVLEQDANVSAKMLKERTPIQARKRDVASRVNVHSLPPATHPVDTSRYEEMVEEKKALEALIAMLRAHLTRLTAELSDHGRLLGELRALRDQDASALQEKGQDVDKLRQEVERLSGEVEVLRGVVEEGLKERREVREQSLADASDSSSDERSVPLPQRQHDMDPDADSISSDDEPSRLSRSVTSAQATPRSPRQEEIDTDVDFEPLSRQAVSYINPEELDRISEEVEERRSERSLSRSTVSISRNHLNRVHLQSPPRPPSPRVSVLSTMPALTESSSKIASGPPPASLDDTENRPYHSRQTGSARASTSHDGMLLDEKSERLGESSAKPEPSAPVEAPFPQIRGTRMERLFFSAPQHDSQTCNLCHRKRRPRSVSDIMRMRFSTRIVSGAAVSEDEGSVRGAEKPRYSGDRGANQFLPADPPSSDKLPPQTVLTRVLRELEDDFTHYKAIYVELADQYKVIDAASNVIKRNVLAEHVHDVVDMLEQKGDQIASLYELLSYGDKPIAGSTRE